MAQIPLVPGQGESPTVAARIPEPLRDALRRAAARRGVTPSDMLRAAIERLVSDELDELAAELSGGEPP